MSDVKAGRPGSKLLVIVGSVDGNEGMPTTGVILPSVPVRDEVNGTDPKGKVVVWTGAKLKACVTPTIGWICPLGPVT